MSDAWQTARASAHEARVRIEELDALHDTVAVNEVIAGVWGSQLLAHELLQAMQHAGCVLLGAREATGSSSSPLVGFVFGFAGFEDGLHVHSHMLAVVPQAQGRGIGLALKLAQRASALDAAITDIRWTFDPMLLGNARFNLLKLGAVAWRFLPDFYGAMSDELNRGERSDRFEVSWAIESERVARAVGLDGGRAAVPGPDAVSILEAHGDQLAPLPVATGRDPQTRALVAIPRDHMGLRRADPALASAWRDAAGRAFRACFECGLVATSVTADGRYLFEPPVERTAS